MADFHSHIGKLVVEQFVSLENSDIQRMRDALGEHDAWGNRVCDDIDQAICDSVFSSVIASTLGDGKNACEIIGITPKQIIHSRERIFQCETIKPGDTLHIQTIIKDMYEQQANGNPIGFLVLHTFGKLKTHYAFMGERIFSIRGGFPRS